MRYSLSGGRSESNVFAGENVAGSMKIRLYVEIYNVALTRIILRH